MDFIGSDPSTGDPARPLLLLLHGYGANERDLPPIMDRLPGRFDWVSLRAPLPLPNGGWAWVPLGAVPASPDPVVLRAGSAAVLAWLDAHAAGRTVVPLGFSQGGLLVTQLLRERPASFAAGVVLSGFVGPAAPGGDQDGRAEEDAALRQRRPAVFFGRGDADPVIPAAAFEWTSRWLAEHTDLTERVYPGLPHSISVAELDDIAAFLDTEVPGH